MVLKRDEQRQILLEKWEKQKEKPRMRITDKIQEMFDVIKRAACSQMTADVARFSRLINKDEAIYTHLAGLMTVYKRVIEFSDDYQDENANVVSLLSMINTELTSRLRLFKDVESQETNPITVEKTAILDYAKHSLSEQIDDLAKLFATGLRDDDDAQVWDEAFDLILKSEFYNVFSTYREVLRSCINTLDDIESREILKFCTDFMESEWKELGNIVNVQVRNLDDAAAESGGNSNVVLGITDSLRDAYQKLVPIIGEFKKLLMQPQEKTAQCCTFDEFELKLTSVFENAKESSENDNEFFDALKEEIEVLINGLNMEYMKAAYKLQRVISSDILLADEIRETFENVLKDLLKMSEDGALPAERDIIKGIEETISIKIESIKENALSHSKNGMELVKTLSVEKGEVPNDERDTILCEIRNQWISSPPAENEINQFFDKALNGDGFKPFNERADKQIAVYFDKANNAAYKFKKEVLLYEICTYEEILVHSVSRLRSSQQPSVMAVATVFDAVFRTLEIILKKNNISVIRPQPHDSFDAKEHEVLVAEKQEGFERGEIIKIVTAGYRSEDRVILRANVIAAKS